MIQNCRLLIPDADVIIHLHQMGILDQFLSANEVYVARTVSEESDFSVDTANPFHRKNYIDLSNYIDSGKITLLDLDAEHLCHLERRLDSLGDVYVHDGEKETIGIVSYARNDLTMCLIDHGAIRCSVLLGMASKCVSIEQALQDCGLGRKLPRALTDKIFKETVRQAEIERIQRIDPNSPQD